MSLDNIPIGLYTHPVRPSRGRSHETHEGGDGCGARAFRSRQPGLPGASGLRPTGTNDPCARSSLKRFRPCPGRNRDAGATEDASAARGQKTPPWSAAGRAPFRQRVPASRKSADRIGCATRRSIPLSAWEGQGRRADPAPMPKNAGDDAWLFDK